MNANKKQLICIGTRCQLEFVTTGELQLKYSMVSLSSKVTDLWVFTDKELTTKEYVANLCKNATFTCPSLDSYEHRCHLTQDPLNRS